MHPGRVHLSKILADYSLRTIVRGFDISQMSRKYRCDRGTDTIAA
jgi:hypothetical protein